MNTQAANLLVAGISLAAYVAMCLMIWWRARVRMHSAARLAVSAEGTVLLVIHASQTGTAESVATQTASALQTAGVNVNLRSLAQLDLAALQSAHEALFVVSTYGEGDPPDAAVHFVATLMRDSAASLPGLRYGLLALGDRNYSNFCGFGRDLDTWLQQHGATPLFERIEVDSGDPAALTAWRHELGHIAATTDLPQWQDVPFESWLLRSRQHLNPGSQGAPVFHLELVHQGAAADWQAGDLLQVQVPSDPARPRDYSIASIPVDGAVHLLVRQQVRADGRIGAASAWLTRDLALGAELRARLRVHSQFRIGDNANRDLILIGNGTGIAGLRAHLRQRAQVQLDGVRPDGAMLRHWLLFGERQAACDALYGAELAAWRNSAVLTQLDLVYSRDAGAHHYVQDCLRAHGERLREWVDAGAAIYVCGSLEGMAEGVDAVLREQLGEALLARLQQEGRYRRDVY
jgi:sulfite reductase (NADPH) flavoprotein alpha-component